MDIRDILKNILRSLESEKYSDALALFGTIFNNQNEKILPKYTADITALFIFVFSKISIIDRAIFARSISKSPNVPEQLIRALLKETPIVSSHLVLLTPFTDAELIDMIEAGDLNRRLMITQRPNLTRPVTDQLTAGGELPVLVSLAQNTTASLSARAFSLMASVAMDSPDMDKALAGRADLPIEIATKLSRRLRETSQARISRLIAEDLAPKRRPLVLRGPGVR